jgi:signal transduction histidine kinase
LSHRNAEAVSNKRKAALGGSTISGGTPGVLKHAASRTPLTTLRARLHVPEDVPLSTLPVSAAGAALFVAAIYVFASNDPGLSSIVGSLALLGAALLAEAFPVPIEGVAAGRTSLANIFIVGVAVIYGWAEASIIGALTMGLVELAHRRPPSRITFNTGLYTLAAGAAGATASSIEGTGLAALLLAVAVASTAFYLVDITLLSAVIAEATMRPFLRVWGRSTYSTAAPFAIMTSLAAILVVLWDRSPYIAVALAGPLVAIALYERRVHSVLERLRELDRLKNEFIAVVSHELRTPVASVYGATMTLQQRELDERRRNSLLSVIFTESARLARLVEQVVWASRFEAGHARLHLEPCEPLELAVGVIEAARLHLPPTLSIELSASSPPTVLADPERVRQVLVNLLDNAVKFSPAGGRIEVAIGRSDGVVRFAVKDEGIGIPAKEQARIFEKFHRLDPNLTRGVGGTGLGLYICQELVRQMNGRIWVDSRENEGSTFLFELPRAN